MILAEVLLYKTPQPPTSGNLSAGHDWHSR